MVGQRLTMIEQKLISDVRDQATQFSLALGAIHLIDQRLARLEHYVLGTPRDHRLDPEQGLISDMDDVLEKLDALLHLWNPSDTADAIDA
jgi:hypothetical protein